MSEPYRQFTDLMRRGRHREAADLAEAESARNGGASCFWLTRRAAALNRASAHEEALSAARAALGIEPANPYAVLAAGEALFGLQRPEEALGHFREVVSHEKVGARARTGLFESLAKLGRWEELQDRLAQAPEEERHQWRVKSLCALGRTLDAIEECRKWLAIRPHHPPALWELVELEVKVDGLEAVRLRYEKLARIPTLPGIYREVFASLCRRAGLPERALQEYEKIETSGMGTRLQKKQAFLLAKTGREREAIPLLEELLRLEPRDVYLHSSYGAACARADELERAITFYIELMGRHPEEKGLYGRINRLKKRLEARSRQSGPAIPDGAAPVKKAPEGEAPGGTAPGR
jgi:tetratricopeptide (TPR) repeat protein